MLFEACIIDECWRLVLIINSPQVVGLKVGHFSMPEVFFAKISDQKNVALIFCWGWICGEQIRRSVKA